MMPTHIVVCLAIAGLVVFEPQARKFGVAGVSFLTSVVEAGENLLGSTLRRTVSFLGKDGTPRPIETFSVLVIVSLSTIAAGGDFVILRKTIGVIWPWEMATGIFAINLVALASLGGFIAHNRKGSAARVGAIAFALVLVAMEGFVAFIRASEAAHFARLSEVARNSQNYLTLPGLMIENSRVVEQDLGPPATTATQDKRPSLLPPILAAGAATLFGIGQVLGYWAAVSTGGGVPLLWIFSAPLLLIFGLPYSFFVALRNVNITRWVRDLVNGFFDCTASLRAQIVRTGKNLSPDAIRQRHHAREAEIIRQWLTQARLQANREVEEQQLILNVEDCRQIMIEVNRILHEERVKALVAAWRQDFSKARHAERDKSLAEPLPTGDAGQFGMTQSACSPWDLYLAKESRVPPNGKLWEMEVDRS